MSDKYKGFKNRRTKSCPVCNEVVTSLAIKGNPLVGQKEVFGVIDPNFYGGQVKKFCLTKHDCGAELLLYLKQYNGEYRVHDIATRDEALNKPIDKPVETLDNIGEGDAQEVENQSIVTQDDDLEEDVATELSVHDLNLSNVQLLTQCVLDGNLEDAMLVIDEINVVQIPNALIAAGIPEIDCRNKSRILSKTKYKELVKAFVSENHKEE